MATVNLMFAEVDHVGLYGGAQPSLRVPPLLAETIGNPVASTQSSAAPGNGYVRITCDNPVWIIVGSNPTATAGTGEEILITGYDCFSIAAGMKIAVINAA